MAARAISWRIGLALVWIAIGTMLGALLPVLGMAVIAAFIPYCWLPIRGEIAPYCWLPIRGEIAGAKPRRDGRRQA